MVWIKIKASLILVLTIMCAGDGKAQTWSEWFSQKKTQQKYLIEQVAALKIYSGYLKKGYEIGRSGLTFIKGTSKGEFDLHSAFFRSLKMVSPAVRNNIQVAEIIQMEQEVSQTLKKLYKVEGLERKHQTYLRLVGNDLLDQCRSDIGELLLLVTSGRAQLADNERLERIDKLHGRLNQKRDFALSLYLSVTQVAAQRIKELETIKRMEEWYEKR